MTPLLARQIAKQEERIKNCGKYADYIFNLAIENRELGTFYSKHLKKYKG